MPELPEMETYKRLLAPRVTGRTVTLAEVTREKSVNLPMEEFIRRLTGARMTGVDRRAKHLLLRLEGGQLLLLHLMLGGSLFWGKDEEKPDRSVQVRLSFGPESLHFIGLRLGYLHLLTNEEAEARLAKLGPEPTSPDLSEAAFTRMLRGKRGRLKPVLVDQSFLAGIGNCYSDEICFHAGILPYREIRTLSDEETAVLYRSMRTVLAEASSHGGYMDMPFYKGDTLTGGFDPLCRIYDREGEPCVRCGEPVHRDELGGRKMFYCPACQH